MLVEVSSQLTEDKLATEVTVILMVFAQDRFHLVG